MSAYLTKTFQFHNGSIKSNLSVRNDEYPNCFNSTMVRLKALDPSDPTLSVQAFQFHNGSIKSPKNQLKILYKTRTISTRRKLSLGSKVVNVQLCKINGRLTRSRGYASIP